MKITTFIVDDEVLMAEELQCLLSPYHSLEICELCHDSDKVIEKINKLHPDVMFLDIRMPGLSGMDVVRQIEHSKYQPLIIFSTAYDSYAIEAFRVDAFDYVLKPYDEREIKRIVNKLQKHFVCGVKRVQPLVHSRKFTVNLGDSMAILESSQIQMIYAKDRRVFIQNLEGKIFKAKLTLQDFEVQLDPQQFFRCHRNYIVNVDQIKAITSWFNRGYLLILKGEKKTEVSVSRAYVNKLREYIQF